MLRLSMTREIDTLLSRFDHDCSWIRSLFDLSSARCDGGESAVAVGGVESFKFFIWLETCETCGDRRGALPGSPAETSLVGWLARFLVWPNPEPPFSLGQNEVLAQLLAQPLRTKTRICARLANSWAEGQQGVGIRLDRGGEMATAAFLRCPETRWRLTQLDHQLSNLCCSVVGCHSLAEASPRTDQYILKISPRNTDAPR